ncbi:MAG: hypothetical protein GY930_13220 [bacterium]|nr:hypothetical protein [bacterium]
MHSNTVSRAQIIDRLSEDLSQHEFILAAWMGGSDATGRTDELSDIDMQILCQDGQVDQTFAVIHAAAESFGPIVHRWRLPEPTWHGHSQELSRVAGAGIFSDLDLVVLQKSAKDRFLEFERHGDAQVLFDREGVIGRAPFDRTSHNKKMVRRLTSLRDQFPLCQAIVIKAIRRKLPVEACAAYLRMTLMPMVELLRMRFAPDLFDFGFRYLDRDLPEEWRSRVEGWALPKDGEELAQYQQQIDQQFNEQLAALDRGEWKV